jgi:hypothetical protein
MAEKFRQDWIKEVTEDILWICQLPRSGGTLLLRLLDSHPEFHCYPAVISFPNDSRVWPHPSEIKRAGDNTLGAIFSNMNLEKFHLQGLRKQSSNMQQEIYPIYFSARWYREIFHLYLKANQSRKIKKERKLFDSFFTAVFNAWRNNQNLYGDKKYIAGQMTLRKPELYKTNYENFKFVYPKGKMIFILRKPDDWLASAYKLKTSTPYTGIPEEIINDYKTHLKQVLEMVKDESFILFKFEDFILKPRKMMTALADKLKISWNESLLTPTFNGAPFYPNSSFRLKRKAVIDPGVIGRGKQLPKTVLAAIDKECLDLYKKVLAHKKL